MKRKALLILALALSAALLTVGVVAAQANGPAGDGFDHPHGPGGPGGPGRGTLGQVTVISGNRITVETLEGDILSFNVTADTQYHSRDVESVSLADIAVGSYIGAKLSDDGATAEIIAVLPEDFDPANRPEPGQGPGHRGRRGAGLVTAVDGDSITIESRNGESHEIALTAETEYLTPDGETASLADVVVGNYVGIKVVLNDDGDPTAEKVVILPDDFEPGVRPEDGTGNGPAFQGGDQG
jgi:hypothetical protein